MPSGNGARQMSAAALVGALLGTLLFVSATQVLLAGAVGAVSVGIVRGLTRLSGDPLSEDPPTRLARRRPGRSHPC